MFHEEQERNAGRPTNLEARSKEEGRVLRNSIRDELVEKGFSRPTGRQGIFVTRNEFNRACHNE